MSEPQFGCPACQSTNVRVRSKTEGYDYDKILRWTENSEPAEVEPFDPAPVSWDRNDEPKPARRSRVDHRFAFWFAFAPRHHG